MTTNHRQAHRSTRLVSIALIPLLVLAGCTGGGTGSGASPGTADGGTDTAAAAAPLAIDYKEAPAAAATRLATAIAAAGSLDELRPLAREALARTGVATVDPTGAVLAAPGARSAGLPLLAAQVDNLALDQLEGEGWTLADLAKAVADHPQGPGAELLDRPTTLGKLMRAWASVAADHPDDPEAFAPLLLAALAKARGGSADFTTGTLHPDAVPLTYLELAILTAGSLASAPGGAGEASASAGTGGAGHTSARVPVVAPADDKGPCAWVEQAWGKGAQDFAEEGSGALFDEALDKVRDWLAGKGEEALSAGMKLTGNVLKAANFLTSVIAMYGGYGLSVKWDPAAPHYLGYDGGHGDVKLSVTAEVTTRPQADDATLACLKFLGIEKPDSESVKDATVAWIPLHGTPKHATVTSKDLTKMAVSAEGTATLELAMSTEKSTEAGRTGKLKKDTIVIQAELTPYKSTPSKIAAAGVFGGVWGGNLEVAKGWLAAWFPKRVVATIPVAWHQLPVWRGVVERPDGTRWVFLSGQGAKSIWSATHEGGPIQAGPTTFKPSGKASFDLTSGSTDVTLVRQATATMLGYAITMVTHLPMSIELTGTDEAPTLTVTSKPGTTVVSAAGQTVSKSVEPGGTTVVTLTEMEQE